MKRSPKSKMDPSDSINVGSVRTFLDALEEFPRGVDSVDFYRGHSKHTHQILPSVYRRPGWINNEDILFKELILRCPSDFSPFESTFQTLVKMQHYSLPTRLLDLTSNPLISLFFACWDFKNVTESGEVLVFRIPKREIKYFDSDTVSVIANISRRPSSFKLPRASKDIAVFNNNKEIRYLLHEVKKEKPYFEPLIERSHLESVVCVKPKMDNARIIRQGGAFLLFGVDGMKSRPAHVPDEYLLSKGNLRIIIKQDQKPKIIDQLETLGITRGDIYPEIDGVATHIKEVYFGDD